MATLEQRPAGLTPPHDLEAEEAVLGAILLSDRTMYAYVIEEGLKPEDFYRERHRVVYAAMRDLYDESEPVDEVTVCARLAEQGRLEELGGRSAVEALAGAVPTPGNLRHYGRIVRETALLRRLLTTSYDIQGLVHSHDATPRELVEQAERAILEVAHDERKGEPRKIDAVLDAEIDKLQQLSRSGAVLTGTPSGYGDLDELTGGFQPGNLVIVAARPSMGKSALVVNIAENAALQHGRPVALFSLEMSESELAQRFLASQASIPGEDLRRGKVEQRRWGKVLEASQRLSTAPLFIDDSSDLSLLDIRAKARRLHQQHGGLGLVIVDYLQLMRPDGRTDNRVEQIGQMSRGLKILAGELQVPVIALSQLNRGVELRAEKRPVLSDLRESGSIEQDADLVIFIYRDEYYNKETTDREGEADLIVAKHRNGRLGDVVLTFQHQYPRFMNYAGDRYAA